MKNKGLIFIIVSCCLWNVSWAAIDASSFMAKRRQSLMKQRHDHEARRQQINEGSQNVVASDDKKANKAQETTVTCDCEDPNSPYNYPTNFCYDIQKNKLYRLNPYCKCSKSGTVPVSPLSEEEQPAQENTYQWNISY